MLDKVVDVLERFLDSERVVPIGKERTAGCPELRFSDNLIEDLKSASGTRG